MRYVPIRDSKGNLVAKAIEKTTRKETLRSIIGRLTNDGETTILNMVRLANMTPIEITLPDGRTLEEPIVPTAAVALEANKWLAEQLGGKAVAQNEVDRTATENEIIDQLRSLSDDELEQRVKKLVEGRPSETTIETLPEEEELPVLEYPGDEE